MGLCKLIVIVGVAALFVIQPTISASIGGQKNVCLCTREYDPMCGSDGITYSNKCVFECEKRVKNDLELVSYGDCDDAATRTLSMDEQLCMCTREYEPICGTDGQTYSNKCMFKCAQMNNNALKYSSYGECVEVSNLPLDGEIPEVQNLPFDGEIPEVQQYEESCVCTREYEPICGTDGTTYSNKCMFSCAKNTNKNLEMLTRGECADISNLPLDGEIPEVQNLPFDGEMPEVHNLPADEENDVCLCTLIYDPLCGSDGNTYSNECEMNCAKKLNRNLEVFAQGECIEIQNLPAAAAEEEELMCACPLIFNPVCGSDGQTYSNECNLNCAKKFNRNLDVHSKGACIEVQNLPFDSKTAEVQQYEESCVCTREYEPICGTDGTTYSNKCMFNCAKKTNKQLEFFATGKCIKVRNFPAETENVQVQNLPANEELCVCTKEYSPVCGSDGTTYSNKCMMTCEQHNKVNLIMKHSGEC